MILTGKQIIQEVNAGRIVIDPFCIEQVTTNAYDLRVSDLFIEYTDDILDPRKKPNTKISKIQPGGYVHFDKGSFKLGCSKEIIGSDHFVPIIHAKSGIARLGMFVHVTADLIDIGSIGKTTFQMYATLPVDIPVDTLIAQVSFWVPKGKIVLYKGKYQGSSMPMASLSYQSSL